MRVEKKYKKAGYFWLPNKEKEEIPGVLTIEDGGKIELEVVGLFGENLYKNDMNNSNLGRIIGRIEGDGFVTLDDCFYTEKNLSVDGISRSKVLVNLVLSGVLYKKDEKITFNTLSFSVERMDEWIQITGINVKDDLDNKACSISYSLPESIRYQLENGMELKVCFKCKLPQSSNRTEAKITQEAYFKLESSEPRDLNDFREIAYKLVHFMCFATDDIVALKNMTATSVELQKNYGENKKYHVPVSIYYQSIPYSKTVPNKNWRDMLFIFPTIKQNAQSALNNWINAYESLSPTLELYFSTKTGAQKYLDGKFLLLAQTLETYHRRTSNERLMDSNEFTTLKSKIIENCPKEHIEWLKYRLMYGNEINLRKRIKNIIEPFKDYLGSCIDRNNLSKKIVDTRNYLTHYNPDLKTSAANGKELWGLCQKMEFILQLHFLRVIGFDNSEIENAVQNSYPLKEKIRELHT